MKGLYTGTTAGALLSKLEDGPTLYDASGEPKADADAVATGIISNPRTDGCTSS